MTKIKKLLNKKALRVTTAILLIVLSFILCATYFRNNIVPIVIESSEAQVRAIGTNAVNLAATTVLQENIKYEDLFTVVKNEKGDIEMIQANSPRINSIARQIANLAQANLDDLGVQNLDIALGTFTGLALLTGFGPDVSIKIMPIGTANCDFVSTFISAGINQTIHRIYIDVYADIDVITPIADPTICVKAEVLVCENVIIGKIPDTYLMLGNSGDILNLSPSS
ncbi:MAG: sporulation protein YunB [Clostridia bacterium]|nr:sporulation protein YunB [Clostridia bacterium]